MSVARWCPECGTKQEATPGELWTCVGCGAQWSRPHRIVGSVQELADPGTLHRRAIEQLERGEPQLALVTLRELVALAGQRDAFLAGDECNTLLHYMADGQHVVELSFLPDSDPSNAFEQVQGKGEHYWTALRAALETLRTHRELEAAKERETSSAN